jgi:hypothetical protein
MTNPITIEIDIAGDTPIQDAFATITEYDGVLKNFIAISIETGHPLVTIEFPSMSLACSYLFDVGVAPEEMDLYFVD